MREKWAKGGDGARGGFDDYGGDGDGCGGAEME